MNRIQAIAKATHFRIGKGVATIASEREAAVEGKEEIKDDEGKVIQEAVEAKAYVPRTYHRTTFESIALAKKRMRELGIGVALVKGEKLPV